MKARVLIAALASVMLATGVGFAAGVTIDAEDLTTYSSASDVPTLSTCTLTASADTFVEELNPLTTHGGDTTMRVRSLVVANERSFVRFDLSACSFAASADVSTASLELYLSTAPVVTRTYDVHRVTASWVEASLQWSGQPSVAAGATGTISTGTTSGVTKTVDVKADVKAFVEGTATNHGWRLKDQSESSVTVRTGTFNTREHATSSTRPTLRITYYP